MGMIAALTGILIGCAIGYFAVPAAPEWAARWAVASVLFFTCFLVSLLKNRFSPSSAAFGFLLSAGLMTIEWLSSVAISSAVVLFWVFCLFREIGTPAVVGAES